MEGDSKHFMIKCLTEAGWKLIRKRGEPIYFIDPLGCEPLGMRIKAAYSLLVLREQSRRIQEEMYYRNFG